MVQYLAVRLWYERELVHQSCRQALAIDGNVKAIAAEMQKPGSPLLAGAERNETAGQYSAPPGELVLLARALELEPALLMQAPDETLRTLLEWMHGFPKSAHGPLWLKAFEDGYQEQLLEKLRFKIGRLNEFPPSRSST